MAKEVLRFNTQGQCWYLSGVATTDGPARPREVFATINPLKKRVKTQMLSYLQSVTILVMIEMFWKLCFTYMKVVQRVSVFLYGV